MWQQQIIRRECKGSGRRQETPRGDQERGPSGSATRAAQERKRRARGQKDANELPGETLELQNRSAREELRERAVKAPGRTGRSRERAQVQSRVQFRIKQLREELVFLENQARESGDRGNHDDQLRGSTYNSNAA